MTDTERIVEEIRRRADAAAEAHPRLRISSMIKLIRAVFSGESVRVDF